MVKYLTILLACIVLQAKADNQSFWWAQGLSASSGSLVLSNIVQDYIDYSNFTAGTVSPGLTPLTNSVYPIGNNDFTGPPYNGGPASGPGYYVNGSYPSTCTNFVIVSTNYHGYTFLPFKTPVHVWGTNYSGNDGQVMMLIPETNFTTLQWDPISYPTVITNFTILYMVTIPNGTSSGATMDAVELGSTAISGPPYTSDAIVLPQWYYSTATNQFQVEWIGPSGTIKTNSVGIGTLPAMGDALECEININCYARTATVYCWDASQNYALLMHNTYGPLFVNEELQVMQFGNLEAGTLSTNDYFWGFAAWKGNPITSP